VSVDNRTLALVLHGGGARAAYQAGVLRALGRRFPQLSFPILTGVSAGAINAAYLANHGGGLGRASADLADLWRSLTVDAVFHAGAGSLASHVLRWGLRLVSGGLPGAPHVRGLVSTAPLRDLLWRSLTPAADGRLQGLRDNLARGRVRALAVVTLDYTTGSTVTWVDGQDLAVWQRPGRRAVRAEMTVDHVMASAALPLFFPAVGIGGAWYGDGGARLTAPLAPAIHLGAGRILALSTRSRVSPAETGVPAVHGYPPPAQILGLLLSAVFLDALDYDAHLLARINGLLAHVADGEAGGMRPIKLYVLRPSMDLSRLAAEHERRLPGPFRFLTRGAGTRETSRPDSLSMVMFEHGYLARLLDLGEADAGEQIDELAAFLA
jgi:NTE family protein